MARPEQTSTETILAAVAAHPEAAAVELAGLLGIGRSTAAKRLAAMEGSGAVRRIPGGREAGVRVPDRWAVSSFAGVEGGSGAKASAASAVPAGGREGGRLGRGALRALVLDYVRSQSGEVGPSAIASALQRSAGAVGNSLAKLAAGGEIRLTSESPRRYARVD